MASAHYVKTSGGDTAKPQQVFQFRACLKFSVILKSLSDSMSAVTATGHNLFVLLLLLTCFVVNN